MKKSISLFLLTLLLSSNLFSQLVIQRYKFDGNNICNYFQNTGIFNQNTTSGNSHGFFWYCDPEQYYCFTAGFNMSGKINGQLAQFANSYRGEMTPGYVINSVPHTNTDFKIYGVKPNDNENTNPDYANWYKMVPYGAPYIDVNNNCTFDIGIDKPGVADASQTLFICMTDAFVAQKSNGEGFGGGVNSPLFYADVRLTVWGYSWPLPDVQFLKYQVINNGNKNWDSVYFAIFADPDIMWGTGGYTGEYIGCDSAKNLGFAYSGDTNNVRAAYGVRVLKGPVNKQTGDTLYLTSFTHSRFNINACEGEANGEPTSAYHYMMGYKKDLTSYLDPTFYPPQRTKYVYSGDPESNTGWTPKKGYIGNCGTDTGTIISVFPWDAKFHINSGANNLTIMPGDTQTIYYAQMLAKGTSNPNSVTQLKRLSDVTNVIFKQDIYHTVENNCSSIATQLPEEFSLSQNYPNPFNASTIIKYNIPRSSNVKIVIYDLLGREVAVPVNGQISAGFYELNISSLNLSSGIYLYRMIVIDNSVSNAVKLGRILKMVVVK